MAADSHKSDKDGLIAILKNPSDLAILRDQGWYRIPVQSAPRGWPPCWLAFYQPKSFGDDAYRVRYFGLVKAVRIASRREIFPNEIESARSDKQYYLLDLVSLTERSQPIFSIRPRRLVFVPTTWSKFERAEQINDLFDDSPLEDHLWEKLKQQSISGERQWAVTGNGWLYYLDIALFCTQGQIDIETDGDTWHSERDQIARDNERDNHLQTVGWSTLRFNSQQVNELNGDYCLREIEQRINSLGGLSSEGIVPRKFYGKGKKSAQQLSLFEKAAEPYLTEAEVDSEID